MTKRPIFASLLLLSSALVAPAALAQDASAEPAADTPPVAAEPATDDAASADEEVDISIPGGADQEIVVTGRFTPNIVRSTPEVVSSLSSADIARTGEGDISGSLQRVTGLSVVGGGFVYVRGLGDRYSLALLNGSPLPSPEPLKRVVPLDIFPTNVIDSTLVQKSFSVNFPGEFGGGVINLTTKATPREPFLTFSGGIGWDSETTNQLGYTYYGSDTDWTGFDDGTRDVPPLLKAALASGKPILEGADFTQDQLEAIQMELVNAETTLLQQNDHIPINWSAGITGGTTIALPNGELGIIATAGISNKWRTRDTLQQTSVNDDLSGDPQTSYNRVITDNRVVVNGLLGFGLELGDHKIRWTNLYIRDTLKQARLALGTDANQSDRDIMKQDTAWYERQLINTQLVGEFHFDRLKLDLRGAYANSQREAPYERGFTYVRTNQPGDPVGDKFVNDLGGNRGDATIAFSDLNEDLWSGGVDLSYELAPRITATVGYAYSDTHRVSERRTFQFRASNLPLAVQQLRPDYLLSDATIQLYDITLLETSAQDGTAAFDAKLTTHAGYGQLQAEIVPGVNVNAGVRYEEAKQTVVPIDLFGTGSSAIVATNLNNDYWLPAVTLTWEVAPDMQLRVNGSKTIARPQFRELVAQVYQDPESNRLFRGNPSLTDSELWNAEARYEWYFAKDQRLTVAGFYKSIDNPIETYTSISDSSVNSSYANAPKATLYGAEVEVQKYFPLDKLSDSPFWQSRRLVLIGNYTYTKSEIRVRDGDTTVINGVVQNAANFFFDGAPMTGQSDHLLNFQIGLEDQDKLSQQTLLLTYASPRVTSRGPSGQPDLEEKPGIQLDFVARQGLTLLNKEIELKFEARNLTGRKYQEVQTAGDNKIFFNRYKLGRTFSLSASVKF
ncbi:TonB-dependent receptor domain-containing protein [Sphingopyxis macrogoltabida]|uniref:TonB-dependent receptor n=1 Tax=Sphingopyxis macrogoltabida TaxID=33050 RepID=A0AAC9AW05_SPHMC|nr:TonB-dependent receptor [Sphingopyxis macrogoltabida]ALJ14685.1 TonB-dependent receptor [Sphingopyxis macrogoltabida]AMU90944.1 TonB-dependent receptor [Sphingopyxis macrogoltabida]